MKQTKNQNQTSGLGRIIGICILAAGVLCAVLVLVFSGISKKDEKIDNKSQEDHQMMLERFLEQDDYKALYDYIDNNNLYSSDYGKYREVYDVYSEYLSLESSLEWLKELKEGVAITDVENKKENVYYVLYSACSILFDANEHIYDETPQQNEGDLQKIYEWTVEKLAIFGFDTAFGKGVTEWKGVSESDVRKHVDSAYAYYFEIEKEEE